MKSLIFFLGCLVGMYIAWYFDNKAFQKYKKEIEKLKRALKMWTMSG